MNFGKLSDDQVEPVEIGRDLLRRGVVGEAQPELAVAPAQGLARLAPARQRHRHAIGFGNRLVVVEIAPEVLAQAAILSEDHKALP